MSVLEVKNLKKNFGELEVLKNISFDLEQNEVIAIIGSSGSGKSTLLRILNFLENPTEGEINLFGENLLKFDDKIKKDKQLREKRLNFGLVFQDYNLFPHLNVLQNVTLAIDLLSKSQKGVKKEQMQENILANKNLALELIDKVGLTSKLENYPCQLSGGQQQRVAIARALALKPAVLCFDEPTSALDPELTQEVLKVIKNLKVNGYTMIVVTHEMEFAKNVADKIIFMADGVIEEMGSPEEVFGNPKSPKTKSFISQYNNNEY